MPGGQTVMSEGGRSAEPATAGPVITFLSDYGLADEFVGVCHAVMASICPTARVIDLTHGIPRHDVTAGGLALADSLPYLPAGVHLAIVDPDVGARRRAVAMRTGDGRVLVGPDNGLLTLAAAGAGGIVEAVEISASPFRLEPVSATFHGRDIFAPVAARLAGGAALAQAGTPLDPDLLVGLELSRAQITREGAVAHVLHVDAFGNAALDLAHEQLGEAAIRLGRRIRVTAPRGESAAHFARTFADVPPGELLLYEDAARRLALAVSHGSAAARLGLASGSQVRLRPEDD